MAPIQTCARHNVPDSELLRVRVRVRVRASMRAHVRVCACMRPVACGRARVCAYHLLYPRKSLECVACVRKCDTHAIRHAYAAYTYVPLR